MLTAKTLFKRIDYIIEHAYLGFLFEIVGAEFFSDEQKRSIESLGLIIGRKPLLELLYILIRNRPTEGYAKDRTLLNLLDYVALSGILPIINDTQQSTIDQGKASFMEAVESTKQELKKKLKQQIIEANKELKKETTVKRYTTVPTAEKRQTDHTLLLLAGIAGLATVIKHNFNRAFTTQLTDFINESVIDQVAEHALFNGPKLEQIQVYKEVKGDARTCEWCTKFYVKNGKPIIYSLAALQANGSNYGKPKSKWKAVIGSTHPLCRCTLRIV